MQKSARRFGVGLVEEGRGECGFATIYYLARTEGIASRTVYGIAYSALPSPGFRFHLGTKFYITTMAFG